MGKVFQFGVDEVERLDPDGDPMGDKCGGCNWPSHNYYVIADTREDARELIESGQAGMCGDCFSQFLAEENYTVTKTK